MIISPYMIICLYKNIPSYMIIQVSVEKYPTLHDYLSVENRISKIRFVLGAYLSLERLESKTREDPFF